MPCKWDDLTIREINDLLSQIRYVSIERHLFKIRLFIKRIMDALYSIYSEKGTYTPEPDIDLDEDETKESREAEEFYRLQLEAIKHGIPPPKK